MAPTRGMMLSVKKSNESGDYKNSNEKLDVLLKADLTQFADIKNEALKLKDSNDESVKKEEIAQAKKVARPKVAAEAKARANKVETYRKQAWYGMDEDPSFTWDDAYNTIVKVLGKEDDTFFYNGRREVFMDDDGRRYYSIWTEDPNAANTAEGTIEAYLVYDDGSVEPNN